MIHTFLLILTLLPSVAMQGMEPQKFFVGNFEPKTHPQPVLDALRANNVEALNKALTDMDDICTRNEVGDTIAHIAIKDPLIRQNTVFALAKYAHETKQLENLQKIRNKASLTAIELCENKLTQLEQDTTQVAQAAAQELLLKGAHLEYEILNISSQHSHTQLDTQLEQAILANDEASITRLLNQATTLEELNKDGDSIFHIALRHQVTQDTFEWIYNTLNEKELAARICNLRNRSGQTAYEYGMALLQAARNDKNTTLANLVRDKNVLLEGNSLQF